MDKLIDVRYDKAFEIGACAIVTRINSPALADCKTGMPACSRHVSFFEYLVDKKAPAELLVPIAVTFIRQFDRAEVTIGLDYITLLVIQGLFMNEAQQAASIAQAKYEKLSTDAQQACVRLQNTLKPALRKLYWKNKLKSVLHWVGL